jgi:hypothetical protein
LKAQVQKVCGGGGAQLSGRGDKNSINLLLCLKTARQSIAGKHKVKNTKKTQEYNKVNTNKRLLYICKQNTVFAKDVNVPTDCSGSRNTSCRGTGLQITINRRSRIVLEGIRKLTECRMEGQAMFPLKVLMKKQHRDASSSHRVKINLI